MSIPNRGFRIKNIFEIPAVVFEPRLRLRESVSFEKSPGFPVSFVNQGLDPMRDSSLHCIHFDECQCMLQQ